MKAQLVFWIVLFTALLNSSISAAQVWAPAAARWHYSFTESTAEGFIRVQPVGDTLIDAQQWQTLRPTKVWYDHISQSTDSAVSDLAYVRLENDTVWLWRNTTKHVLYDFSAQVGAVWTIAGNEPNCDSLGAVQVDSIGTMLVDGQSLRWIEVSPANNSHWHFTGRIIERIGCQGYLLPEPTTDCGIADIGVGGQLRCYRDSGLVYTTQLSPDCDFLVSVNDLEKLGRVTVSPNPFQQAFEVDCDASLGRLNVEVFTLAGISIEKYESVTCPAQVGSRLAPGFYLLRLSGANLSHVIRIVKT